LTNRMTAIRFNAWRHGGLLLSPYVTRVSLLDGGS
jgi:hypothetical protein